MDSQKVVIRLFGYPENEYQIEKKIIASGGNTGNVVWYESVKDTVCHDKEMLLIDKKQLEINNQQEKVTYIIPMANHICVGNSQLEYMADNLLQRKGNQIVIIGLGSQLNKELNTPAKLMSALPAKRISAIKRLSENAVSLGIRGEITAECLDIIGVHNYRIIGCPSFYSDKKMIEMSYKKEIIKDNLSINISAYGSEGIANFIKIMDKGKYLDQSIYILQEMNDFPKVIFENLPVLERHMQERFPGLDMDANKFTTYIKNHGKIFFKKKSWQNYLLKNGTTLSIGAKFHGNMIAILSGIPAIWIVHDSRTQELCRAMHLPHINIEDMKKIDNLDELISKCRFPNNFMEKYQKEYLNYKKFIYENSVTFKI